MIGEAPCTECNFYLRYIPLTGVTEPCQHCSGKNWQVAPNFSCINCGAVLLWLHEPGMDDLMLVVKEPETVEVGREAA